MEGFFTFVFVMIITFVLFAYGVKSGMDSQQRIDQKIAVEKGYAEYNTTTAKFQWIVK